MSVSRRVSLLWFFSLIGFLPGLAAQALADPLAPAQGPAVETVAGGAAKTSLPAGTRIYLSVDHEGNATFSDHAQPGAARLDVRTYDTAPDPGARARAIAERDYWRAQADAFAIRQRARERQLDRDLTRAQAARAQPERAVPWADVPVRRYYRVAPAPAMPGASPGVTLAPTYQGGPGAASRAGAAFIGSGFAGAR